MSLRDDILDRIDIVDLVSKYVQLKRVGKNRMGLCPFHREKTPSFTVSEDKQIFKCFGCGKGGNAITFYMDIEKADFVDALRFLAQEVNISMDSYNYANEGFGKKQEKREKYKLINKYTQEFFLNHFPDSVAYQYSKIQRGLHEETMRFFGIGYAPESHYELIKSLKEKGFTDEDLIQAGIAKKGQSGDVYSFFRNRLTFPIYDNFGNIVGFGARALKENQNPKYLNTTETPLYDKSKILFGLYQTKKYLRDRGVLIVVEGYMDVVSLYQHGFPIGIATCGTVLTKQHIKIIQRHTEYCIFAFDNDDAGFQATIRGLKVSYTQDLFPKVLQFPKDYKDVDERLMKNFDGEMKNTKINDHVSMKQYLNDNSIDGFTFVLNRLQSQYNIFDPVERKRVLHVCFDLISCIEDYSIITLYIDQLAQVIRSDTRGLMYQLKGFLKKQKNNVSQDYKKEDKKYITQEQYLLASLWYDNFWNTLGVFSHALLGSYKNLIEKLIKYFPQSLLYAVISNTLHDGDRQKLTEAQILRENQIGNIHDDKKYLSLLRFLQKQLHDLEKLALKSKNISHEEKQAIIEEVRNIKLRAYQDK